MNGHARDGKHALVTGGASEMLIALVGEKGLLVLKVAVAIVAKNAGEGIRGRALLLTSHGKISGRTGNLGGA